MKSFEQIKTATETLTIEAPTQAPATQHLPQGKGWDEVHESIFAAMAEAGYPPVLEELDGKPMTKLHTCALLEDFRRNPRAGLYSTDSNGTNLHEPNAFAFPLPNGVLDVYRYGDAAESKDWEKTANGKTRIRYNSPVSFEEAVAATGRFDRRGSAVLEKPDEAFRLLGIQFEIPELLAGRRVTVRHEGCDLFVTVPGHKRECDMVLPGWRYYRANWEHDIHNCLPDATLATHEDCVRLATNERKATSWVVKDDRGCWKDQSLAAAKIFIKGFGHDEDEIARIIHHHMSQNYQLVQIPFAPEMSADRKWNRFGAQLACTPMKGDFPNIQMILNHVGKNLDSVVEKDCWCKKHYVLNGAAYLELWAAVMFKTPERRLPFLFCWAEAQNIGKSSFGRMLTRGFRNQNGWCELRKELTRDDFNGQMRGAALCLLEELDLSANVDAYQLVKKYIDNPFIKVRGIYEEAMTERNYTHFVHTANYRHFCPVFPGDTRLVMFQVDPFDGHDMDWTTTLCPLVDKEMPAFLFHLLNEVVVPPSDGRLSLPVLETDDKREAMAERAAEMQGWYAQLLDLAMDGRVENKTAAELLQQLAETTTDQKLPKTAAALASQLRQLDKKLKNDGFIMTHTEGNKRHPANYTIRMLASS